MNRLENYATGEYQQVSHLLRELDNLGFQNLPPRYLLLIGTIFIKIGFDASMTEKEMLEFPDRTQVLVRKKSEVKYDSEHESSR